MDFKMIFHFILNFLVCTLAFEDLIFVYGEGNKEMTDQGRAQYQMIKERGLLPKYGPCWKSALKHLDEGCRYLSEETQSDIALHITNCFLEMSGHETYNCELDKKPNLRGICINSMTDRAFNVYTEFYTHTQNICWFLRGQVWHETIAENTQKVGKQLEVSAEYQEHLIEVQRESIQLQEKMLRQGKFLEQVLEDVYVSTKAHQEILKLLAQSITSLQSWIVGEISWIDSIIFNAFALFLIFILTSSQRTLSARLPLFFLLFINLLLERLICSFCTRFHDDMNTQNLYSNIYSFVWYSRYAFTFLGFVTLMYCAFTYRDSLKDNIIMLNMIQDQTNKILNSVNSIRRSTTPILSTSNIDYISENQDSLKDFKIDRKSYYSPHSKRYSRESSVDIKSTKHLISSSKKNLFDDNIRYNLRTRQGTPDSGVVQ